MPFASQPHLRAIGHVLVDMLLSFIVLSLFSLFGKGLEAELKVLGVVHICCLSSAFFRGDNRINLKQT